MKRFLKWICFFSIIITIAFIFASVSNPSPNSKISELLNKTNLFNQRFPQEKVYLHLDRPSYWTNDTIWFKAYLKDSPIADCNLHVELSNATGTTIRRKLFWVQSGLAYGDIGLSDTLTSGVYQIRAYTDWMRNFDSQWYFEKNLVLWNLKDTEAQNDQRLLQKREVDIQFFPEGGTFVTGVNTRMAFKATDQNGIGLDVHGIIMDDQGNNLVGFKSGFKGMGSFMLKPQKGKKYYAKVIVSGDIDVKIDLPNHQEEGVTMSIDLSNKDSVKIKVSENVNSSLSNSENDLFLIAQTKGLIFINKKIQTINGVSAFNIGKNKLPTGIIQFTLFDPSLIPICERLIFINHQNFVQLEIKPDKKEYLKREKVQLEIKAFDKVGMPCFTNLSMSVFNTDNQLKSEDYPNNILTQFLLSSELKGIVESPAYYFKDDSLSTQLALDNLMLTHGYRHFEWEEIIEDKFPEVVYQPESGIKIKGIVKTLWKEKPVPNASVTFLTLTNGIGFDQTSSDSSGYFEFPNLFFNDTVSVTLKAKVENKKNLLIELDRTAFKIPEFKFIPTVDQYMSYHYVDDEKVDVTTSFSIENVQKINRKWRLTDTIMLNEIPVIAKKRTLDTRPLRLHEKAEYNMELDTEDDELGNVFHYLEDKFPDVIVRVFDETDEVRILIDHQRSSVIVVDGRIEDIDLIVDLPAGIFERVEIVKNAAVYGEPYGAAICFFTKNGLFARIPKSINMKSSTLVGYSVIRKFYSPNYETQQASEIKNDYRNTIYWNPIIRTDLNGVADVSFYNSDQAGEVIIIVEGIDAKGKLCRGLGQYNVKY